jgi:hypothetical protein
MPSCRGSGVATMGLIERPLHLVLLFRRRERPRQMAREPGAAAPDIEGAAAEKQVDTDERRRRHHQHPEKRQVQLDVQPPAAGTPHVQPSRANK